uniref:Ribosomal protein L31 n=1 Tax=Fucus distichus TaxID=3012 RepID=A0A343C645_FUCDI|nr:ribosomal protein L31 [Fucus distichus]ARI50048.1 ribosomal protein L31 [Fucus distichus]
MKSQLKFKLFGSILSNGSSRFMYLPGYSYTWVKSRNNLDLLNHFIWAGKRVKEQTDITSFVDRFRKV